MNMLAYIQNAQKYIYTFDAEKPFAKLMESNETEHVLIIPNSMVIRRKEFERLLEKYYISELFELANCFVGTGNEPYMFLHVVDKPVDRIKISLFYQCAHIYKDDPNNFKSGTIYLPDNYTDKYMSYLNELSCWVKIGQKPLDIASEREYREISASELFCDNIYTRFYSKSNDEVRAFLKSEHILRLSDIADIIDVYFPPEAPAVKARVLNPDKVPSYPYVPEKDSIEYPASNTLLRKNDIVAYKNGYFLVDKDSDVGVYAPPQSKVYRTRNISPEYLYLYLTSKIARRIQCAYSVPSGDWICAKLYQDKDFPIVLPKEDGLFYKEQFVHISNPDQRIYESYFKPVYATTVDEALRIECTEIIEKLKYKSNEQIKELLKNDVAELERCFSAKSYKAAIVMAGSLLETFLIDWLSSIDGINYFKQDLQVPKKINGEVKMVSADLNGYIQELKKRNGPEWNNCANGADMIRNKRNQVHPKRYLKESKKIDETICRTAIERLKDIIASRNL